MVAAALLGCYWISLRLHPYTKCGRCKGAGRHMGTVFTGAWRNCSKCGGTGRRHRVGAQMLGIGTKR
jgi:DnaJ-class molecular chaperone